MDRAIETATRSTLGCVVGGEQTRIGSFDTEKDLVNNSFVGSRVLRGNNVANQNISLSFDPAILSCLACPKEHSVISGPKPVCICVSDQNFVSNLSGGKNCISVVRVESGNLLELADLVIEIFECSKFPPGSVICVGSVSHLHNVGVTLYAQDWQRCVDSLKKQIVGVQVCPLIPVIRSDFPGSVAADLVELASWLAKQYEGSTLGLLGSWSTLATILSALTVEELAAPTYHTVALPVNLKVGSNLAPHRFRSTSSRRVTAPGCDAKTTDELLSALLTALHSDLGIDCLPGVNSVREPSREQGVSDKIIELILVGSSHMRRVAEPLQEAGFSVKIVTLAGGLPTESAIGKVHDELVSMSIQPGSAIVFDLLGNYTYRYEQADGGLALPVPLYNGHHLLGDIDVVADKAMKSLLSTLVPLLGCRSDVPVVVIPPIPRYICGGCCTEPGHSTNTGNRDYTLIMVNKVAHLRKILRGELKGSSLMRYWVVDAVTDLSSSSVGKADPQGSVSALADMFTSDNVHLTKLGYTRLAGSIADAAQTANKKQSTADCIITGETRQFYWRGFTSLHGGKRAAHSASTHRQGGGQTGGPTRGGFTRQRGHHPYRGHGGQRGRR